jgi:hypothetical protein
MYKLFCNRSLPADRLDERRRITVQGIPTYLLRMAYERENDVASGDSEQILKEKR